MTKEQLIEEAKRRGIVPGAVCRSEYGNKWTVGPVAEWRQSVLGDYHDESSEQNCTIWDADLGWANVVTPVPAQPEGLVDGMACEPDEHMRAAIAAKANELGRGFYGSDTYSPHPIGWGNGRLGFYGSGASSPFIKNLITPGEFYDRLCKTPKPEPPIMVGSREVRFENGGDIVVGCTNVDFATLEKVYNKALSMR